MRRGWMFGTLVALWVCLQMGPVHAASLNDQLAQTMQSCGSLPCMTLLAAASTSTTPPYANTTDNLFNAFQSCSGIPCLTVTGVANIGGGGTFTTNILPKATGSVTLGNSLLTDNGNTLTYGGSGGIFVSSGVLALPDTTASSGQITLNSARLIHSYSTGSTYRNLFVGEGAGNFITSGNGACIGIGTNTLANITTCNQNIAIGPSAMGLATTAIHNTAVGSDSLHSLTSGSHDLAIGEDALYSLTTGVRNAGIGDYAGSSIVTASDNTIIGYQSGDSLTAGYNTLIGSFAGSYLADGSTPNTTGSGSVFIGYGTRSGSGGSSNEVVIGANAIGNGTNSVTLGDTTITATILRGKVGIGMVSPNEGLEMGATLNIRIPNIKSTTGVRYVCVNTSGTLVSQAAACVGT